MRRLVTFLILLLFLGSAAGFAQTNEPAWLVIDRARLLMEQGEFGLAIQTFREALALAPADPDALFGLGEAYKATGDFDVALDYYSQALAQRSRFVIPDDAFLVRYERSDIFRARRDFASYEKELDAIIADAPPEAQTLPDQLHLSLEQQGLDRFLVLFRAPENGATAALGMRAELLIGLGRYEDAAEAATRAMLHEFTTVIDAVRAHDPTFVFTTVSNLIPLALGRDDTQDYLASSSLYHDLYYLGAAFYGERNTVSRAIWQTLASFDAGGTWGNRARRQLAAPRDEPLLVPVR